MSDASGDVRITQREVYNLVVEVRDGVNELRTRDDEADKVHIDHEARIRSIEDWKAQAAPQVAEIPGLLTWRWKVAGALALVLVFISAFGYFIAQAVVHR